MNDGEPFKVEKEPPKYEKIRPMTALLRADIIKKSFAMTIQCVRLPMGSSLRKMFKSANPALNVPRRAEDVAAAFLYADTPTVDSGEKIATIFVGTSSGVTDVYGIKKSKQFVDTLEDDGRERGAMLRLLSDGGRELISERVKKFLRALIVGYSLPAERESGGTELSDSREHDQSGVEPFRCTRLHMVTMYEVRLLRSQQHLQ